METKEDKELYALVMIADALSYLCQKLKRYNSSINCDKLYKDLIEGKITVREFLNEISVDEFVAIKDLV